MSILSHFYNKLGVLRNGIVLLMLIHISCYSSPSSIQHQDDNPQQLELVFYERVLPPLLLVSYENALFKQEQSSSALHLLLALKLAKIYTSLNQYQLSLIYYQYLIIHPIPKDWYEFASQKIFQLQEIQFGEHVEKAIRSLENQQPRQVIEILRPYQNRKSYVVKMALGKAAAMNNNPHEALMLFEEALQYSQNQLEKLESLRQIEKMKRWIHPKSSIHPIHPPQKRPSSPKTSGLWNKNFNAGVSFYNQDNPIQAMIFFEKSYRFAKTDSEKKTTLLYILRTANWIQDFNAFFKAFHLLEKYQLNSFEKRVLLTEHAKVLLSFDYPRHAIFALSQTNVFDSADSILTLSSSYLSAGFPYQAQQLMKDSRSQQVLEKLPEKSYLANRKRDLEYQVIPFTSKGMLNFDFARIQDSTQFIINRETGEGNYRSFNGHSNTSVMLSKSQYYNPTHMVNSDILFIKQDTLNILDKLDLSTAVVPTSVSYFNTNQFSSWAPILWQISANLKANDTFSIYAFNNNVFVETIPSLQNRILMNNTEGTLNLHPLNTLYLNVTFAASHFTDANERLGGSANILYPLSSRYGLFSRLRYRRFQNSYYDNPNYFSPQEMQEGDVFLIYKKRLSAYTYLYADGSIGLQQLRINPVEDLSKQTVYTTQINIVQKITKYAQITISYSYVQNVFNNLVGPYSQEYFGANAKIFLD